MERNGHLGFGDVENVRPTVYESCCSVFESNIRLFFNLVLKKNGFGFYVRARGEHSLNLREFFNKQRNAIDRERIIPVTLSARGSSYQICAENKGDRHR